MTITIIYKGDGKYDPTFDTYTAERTFRNVKTIEASNNTITMQFDNPNTPIITENLDIVESYTIIKLNDSSASLLHSKADRIFDMDNIIFTYRGPVSDTESLPKTAKVCDVYTVMSSRKNVYWSGSEWRNIEEWSE